MKKNIWMMAGCMAALAIATTGCNNDELAESQENGKFVITAGTPTGADTKMDLKDEREHLKITWHDPAEQDKYGQTHADEFSIFTGDGAQTPATFEVKALGSDPHNATFEVKSGSSFISPADGTKIYAFSKGKSGVSGSHNPTTMSLDISMQGGRLDSLNIFGQFFMYAASTSNGTDNINLSFKHVNAVVKLVVLLNDANVGDNIGSIGLSSPNMHKKATLNMTNGQMTYNDAEKGDIITSYGSTWRWQFKANANKQTTVWLTVFPEALTDVKVIAESYDSSGKKIADHEGTLSDITLEAGKMYTATATLTKKP